MKKQRIGTKEVSGEAGRSTGGGIAWHLLGAEDSLSELGTVRGGLTSGEALRRREEYGPNALVEKKRKTPP